MNEEERREQSETGLESAMNNLRSGKRSRAKRYVLITLITVAALLLCYAVIMLVFYRPPVNDKPPFDTETHSDSASVPAISGNTDGRREDVYNILVAGLDDISNSTDVIMICSLDLKNGAASVLQIPRDTYINKNVATYKVSRINAVYAAAYNYEVNHKGKKADEARTTAINALCDVVEQNMCVVIDRYAVLTIDGFSDIINKIGGVEFDVPFDMKYSDPEQDLYIDLKAGKQLLDGDRAAQFVRYRYGYSNADIGRIEKRADFLRAVAVQLKQKPLSALEGVISAVIGDCLSTDVGLNDAVYFLRGAYGIDVENVTIETLAGGSPVDMSSGVVSPYYVMKRYRALEQINDLMNVYNWDIEDSFFDSKRLFTSGNESFDNYYYQKDVKK